MKRNSSGRMLDHSRRAAMVLVALLLLVAGAWSSWGTAQHVLLAKGREHGTLTVADCGEKTCTGSYDPEGPSAPRKGMTIERSVAVDKGTTVPVVVKPGTDELVRTGWAGALHAWLPFGGALLLAALVIGGGLRMTRTAWATAAAGGALLVGAFFAL
ncbi:MULTISPECIES: hypothetical protein [unclassified Streptomyces]|uniref:hypothetical protein n=1 Tax=unclassified Streptomyces TaxID=2593676 RepID=UPI0021C832D2|nr:hypothetical protein [Streptomyces sp. FIT100]UUN27330.1 hypothetical protein KK483_13660 [Streptomyces sp. FIT100]